MTKPHIATLCFAVLACVFASEVHADAPAIDETDTVADIVNTLIERHGGTKATDRWKCGSLKFTTTAGILPLGLGPATVTEDFNFPNSFNRSVVVDSPNGKIDLKFIVNEEGGWMTSPGKPTMEIPRSFADRDWQTFADLSAVTHLREHLGSLAVVKKLDIDGKPAIQLRLDSQDVGSGDFFIDLHSGLLIGTTKTTLDPISGNQAIISTRLGKYEDVDGIPVPMAFTATSNGKKMLQVEIHSVEFKNSIPDSTFTKPE